MLINKTFPQTYIYLEPMLSYKVAKLQYNMFLFYIEWPLHEEVDRSNIQNKMKRHFHGEMERLNISRSLCLTFMQAVCPDFNFRLIDG